MGVPIRTGERPLFTPRMHSPKTDRTTQISGMMNRRLTTLDCLDSIISQLEQQKDAIERALSALHDIERGPTATTSMQFKGRKTTAQVQRSHSPEDGLVPKAAIRCVAG